MDYLTLSGDYNWVGGWGVQFVDGKAQGSTTASAKLHDLITATGEFAIEIWAAPSLLLHAQPTSCPPSPKFISPCSPS